MLERAASAALSFCMNSEKKGDIMKENIRKMIRDLRDQVEEKVPSAGDFSIVYAQFRNVDKGMGVTDWMLKVTKPPKEIEPTQRGRYLELVAYNLPSPYIAESVMGYGNKQDIMNLLMDEEHLVAKIQDKMPDLARDLEDI